MASWAKTLAGELGAYAITVNNVLPGFTDTERLTEIINSKAAKTGNSPEVVRDTMINGVPARRFAHPDETASAVAFLASPAASYINGINLPVDGGRTVCL
jgi:3-oxoacyl-[acyl-carrier protein] reductase